MKIPNRILLMGNLGSGKSTLSMSLATNLDIPYFELDAIQWQANWQMVELAEFRQRVQQICRKNKWVIDGNYSKARDLIMQRVDQVIILDFPLWKSFPRLFLRSLRRIWKNEEMWNGNRESISGTFFSRRSLLLFALWTYRPTKQRFIELSKNPQYAYMECVFLSSDSQVQQYLNRYLIYSIFTICDCSPFNHPVKWVKLVEGKK